MSLSLAKLRVSSKTKKLLRKAGFERVQEVASMKPIAFSKELGISVTGVCVCYVVYVLLFCDEYLYLDICNKHYLIL